MGERKFWTEDETAELRRLMNYQMTYAEIGERMGRSAYAIRVKVSRMGWGSLARAGHLQSLRLKGKKRPAEVMERIVEATRERCKNPEYRAKLSEIVSRNARNPNRLAALRRAFDRKRGGSMSGELAETVNFLRIVKKMPVREAYAVAKAEAQRAAGKQAATALTVQRGRA